jgi:hypothetical protein
MTSDEDTVDTDRQPRGSIGPAARHRAPDVLSHLLSVLREDWTLVGRCRSNAEELGDAGGCFVLAHPDIGVALIDLEPGETSDAEARLRRMLNAADFSSSCRGFLPIVHCRIGHEEIHGLQWMLDQAFAVELPLRVSGGEAWISALHSALDSGVTWEALGTGRPPPRRSAGGILSLPGGRTAARTSLAALVLVTTFGLGLATGILWMPRPDSAVQLPMPGPSSIAGAAPAAAGPVLRAVPQAPPAIQAGTVAEAPAIPAPPVVQPPASDFAAWTPPAAPLPPIAASPAGQAASAPLAGAEIPPGPEIGIGAPAHPARRTARTSFAIDRRCSDAVFRYQQGASLSYGEMMHIRDGCVSLR